MEYRLGQFSHRFVSKNQIVQSVCKHCKRAIGASPHLRILHLIERKHKCDVIVLDAGQIPENRRRPA